MNRIVLIGNGFDLAHGLSTRYQDFIDWYWKQRILSLKYVWESVSADPLCSFKVLPTSQDNTWYLIGYTQYHLFKEENWRETKELLIQHKDLFEVKISPFLENICRSIESKNWVDIENEYYDLLKQYIFDAQLTSEQKSTLVRELDAQLAFLQQKLTEYLSSLPIDALTANPAIHKNLFDSIYAEEVSVERREWFEKEIESILLGNLSTLEQKFSRYDVHPESRFSVLEGAKALQKGDRAEAEARIRDFEKPLLTLPDQILFLSFNYTSTIDLYCPQYDNYFKVNHIHGTLDNPESVIFGYGDELDERYKEIKNQNNNVFLRNIKSIRYLESDNYRKMLQFIDSDPFQVYIVGHSCGNSDRTLLNKLFEHKNCISIKPFYYTKPDGTDNYLEIVQNISRNFTDMSLMRDRVVNKLYCKEITK